MIFLLTGKTAPSKTSLSWLYRSEAYRVTPYYLQGALIKNIQWFYGLDERFLVVDLVDGFCIARADHMVTRNGMYDWQRLIESHQDGMGVLN